MRPDEESREYAELPASIKALYTHQQWLLLSRREKDTLIIRETEPEVA